MAAADILFEDPDGRFHQVLIDAVLSETHRIAALATEDEVDEGIDITDHYREERAPLDLVIAFSDSPHRAIGGPDEFVTSFPVAGDIEPVELDGGSTAQLFVPEDSEITRTVDSWGLLVAATQNAWTATITTKLRTYDRYVLVTGEALRTSEKGTILECSVVFMPIRTAATGRTEGGEPPRPARARNEESTDEGAQSSTEPEEERRQDLINQIIGGAFS